MKDFTRVLVLVLACVSLATVSACKHNNGPPTPWYDSQGNKCGEGTPYPGCNYFEDGYKITVYYDPYYATVDFTPGWGYCDWYGEYCDYYWQSPTGIWYDLYGYALNHGRADHGRDVIGDVGAEEAAGLATTARQFAQKFALADSRALEIVKGLRQWEILTRGRSRTEADYAALAAKIGGVKPADALAAMKAARAGDLQAAEALSDQMAQFWGTDAETMREVLKSWIEAQ